MGDDQIFRSDRDYIGPYLRYLADNMGLRDWYIYGPGNGSAQDLGGTDDVVGICITEYGQKVAHISFRGDWKDQSEDGFRWLCVHELLHCHFRPVQQPLLDAEEMLGKLAFIPIQNAQTMAMEYAIDGIAYDWARQLPLPSEWLDLVTDPEKAA